MQERLSVITFQLETTVKNIELYNEILMSVITGFVLTKTSHSLLLSVSNGSKLCEGQK